MAEEEVGLRLSLKNRRETVAGLDDVGDKLDRAGDEAVSLGRKSRIGAAGVVALGKSGRVAGRAMVYGFGAASAAIVGTGIALTKLSKDSIAEAREAQKVGAITRQEIKTTGGVANVSAKQVSRLAGAISDKAGIDDEAIQTGSNLLLTFKNVRNEVGKGNKIFNLATQAAVDLSAAGFGSIESGSKMLGKALNDPLKGIAALSRAGVTFTEGQKAQIEQFVEQNDLLRAQRLILGEVQAQVGGVAAAQATWGDKAKVSIGNIEERLGTALIPLLDRTEKWFVQKGAPVLEDWVGIFEKRGIPTIEKYAGIFADKAVPAMGDFLDEARPLAKSVIPAIGTGLSTAADAFKIIAPRAKQVFDGFNNLPDWAKAGISVGVLGGVAAKKLGAFDRKSLIGSIASKAAPLPVYVTNPGFGGGPGTPGAGKPGSTAGKVMKYGGAAALSFGAVAFGAEQLGSYLGNRPVKTGVSAEEAAAYRANLPRAMAALPHTPVTTGIDPRTMLPTVNYNAAYSGYDRLVGKIDQSAQFARKFGVSLADANRLMGGDLPRSAEQVRERVGRAVARQADLTHNILGSKAASDELLSRFGLIAKDWRANIHLDGIGTAEARLDSFRSKLSQLGGMDVSPGVGLSVLSAPRREHGGPVKAHRPYVVGERRPELFVPKVDGTILPRVPAMAGAAAAPPPPVHIHFEIDGREIKEVVVDQLLTEAARK